MISTKYIHLSCLYINCHVVIFAETMDQQRDFEQEEILGDIIRDGRDVLSLFLNGTDGLEGKETGYGDRTMEEEGHDYDGSGDRMPVEEGHRDDGSGD